MKKFFQKSVFIVLSLMISASVVAETWSSIENKTRRVNGFVPYYVSVSQGKVWIEISEFDKPFIMYSGLPFGVGSNDIGLDRGQLGESRLVQFERYGDKIFLKQLNTAYRADTDNQFEKDSVNQAFASSVLHGFPIAARLGKKFLIELTPFLTKDLHGVSERLQQTQQGNFSVDSSRSALNAKQLKNFPSNTLFESVLTFKGSKPGQFVQQVTPSAKDLTVHQHLQFVELPDDQYQPRKFHPKSGFFELSYADYASPITESINKKLIYRHRVGRDAKGNLEPITYYLDPGAPEPVKSALLDGAKWWETAFAEAGLEGVYKVEVLPQGVDPMDVRYNVIQWVHRATRGWSYGGSISDPRTGEILKGHVTLGSLRVRQDLLLANALTGAANDDKKQQAALDMALARIRQLSAHEVGHTLGVAHNFAASPTNRASVMDYPHPLVSLRGNTVVLDNAYATGMGAWDIEAIKYGYSEFEAGDEESGLLEIVKNAQKKGLQFISDPDARPQSGAHPQAHLWDNGANAATELERVMAVRKVALANFGNNNVFEGQPYSELAETLVPLYLFHRYQVESAVKLIGGINYEYSVKGTSFQPTTTVSSSLQLNAMKALLLTLSSEELVVPNSVLRQIPPKAYGYYRNRESFPSQSGLALDPIAMAETSAQHTLNLLMNPERLNRVLLQHAQDSEQLSIMAMTNLLLTATLRSPEAQGVAKLVQQRVDYLTVMQLLRVINNNRTSPEVRAHVQVEVNKLLGWLVTQANRNPSRYQFLKLLIEQFNNGELTLEQMKPVKIPPGSPIG